MGFLSGLMRDADYQKGEPRRVEEIAEPDVVISPDTRRENRMPPGQSRTRKWPILDAHGTPDIDLANWKFEIEGLVERPQSWSLDEFLALPAAKVYADFHCVTRWSRLDNVWGGVATRELAKLAGNKFSAASLSRAARRLRGRGIYPALDQREHRSLWNPISATPQQADGEFFSIKPEAKYVLALAHDYGWTTNIPVEYFLAEDSLVAWSHDGEPIPPEHGGPARLIIPQLYAWKSAKWIKGLRFLAEDRAGFWEEGGYHMRGIPWNGRDGERFRYGSDE